MKQYENIWAITSLYRFFPSANRERNFYKFRDNLAKQGVRLAVVEITTNGVPFILGKEDADLLIQLKTQSILWHKERSLNLLIEALPEDCEYVAWFDADCILLDDAWPEQAMGKLQNHCAVQLCSHIDFLYSGGGVNFERAGYVFNCYNHAKRLTRDGRTEGAPGFCWMMKRKLIQEIKLYDKAIIGGGDILFASMTLHKPLGRMMLSNGEPDSPRYKDFALWGMRARQAMMGIKRATYLRGDSQHLWHDERKYRIYGARHFLLLLENFNPHTDLEIEKETGLYTLTNYKIQKLVETYFWFREVEKTPEHNKLFDVYELLMFALKDAGQIIRKNAIEKRREKRELDKLKKELGIEHTEEEIKKINRLEQIRKELKLGKQKLSLNERKEILQIEKNKKKERKRKLAERVNRGGGKFLGGRGGGEGGEV